MSLSVALWVVLLATVLNGFFAGVETGFTSARRVSLSHRARSGSRLGRLAVWLSRRREAVITSAVVGNNVAVVVGTSVLTAAFLRWLGEAGESVAAITMTALTIVFGEILPKAIYRAQPERLVVWSAVPFTILAGLLAPATWVARAVARAVLALMGGDGEGRGSDVSRDSVVSALQLGHRNQILDDREGQMVARFARNFTRPVESVMTSLPQVAALASTDRVAAAVDLVRASGHSRLPVIDPDGNLSGLVLFRDLIHAEATAPLAHYERSLLYFHRSMAIDEAIALLSGHRGNMAAVVDDNNRSLGVLTLEDLLEPLVGDIADEHDRGLHL